MMDIVHHLQSTQLEMTFGTVATVDDSFRPLEWYLKFNGFIPIFWDDETKWWKLLLNWFNSLLNVTICCISVYISFESYEQNFTYLNYEIHKSNLFKSLYLLEPVISIIAGAFMTSRLREILRIFHDFDCQARVSSNFSLGNIHSTYSSFQLVTICHGKLNYRQHRACILKGFSGFAFYTTALTVGSHCSTLEFTFSKMLWDIRYGLYFMTNSVEANTVMWMVWIRLKTLNDVMR